MSLGSADELAGLASAATGGSYGQGERESREANKAARDAHPWAYGAGQLVGGVAGTVPLMIAAPAAFGLKAGMALTPRIIAGARSGAALGGVQGAFEGEGLSDRALGFGTGLATGGAVGAGAPVLGATVGAGVRALTDRAQPALPGIGRAASAEAVNALEQAGLAKVRQRVGELGPQAMVLDLGQPFLGRAQGVAALPGEAGERIISALQARNVRH
jgi:hypothetical protein